MHRLNLDMNIEVESLIQYGRDGGWEGREGDLCKKSRNYDVAVKGIQEQRRSS